MPLAPLPADNTTRYFLQYTVADIPHTLQMRVDDTADDAGAIAAFNDLLDALAGVTATNATYTGVEKSVEGSSVRNPVSGWTPRSGSGAFTVTGDARAFQISFTGRSPDDRKTKAELWGVGPSTDGDFRWEPGDIANLDDAITSLGSNAHYWTTISKQAPVWHTYTNYGYNDHTVKGLR